MHPCFSDANCRKAFVVANQNQAHSLLSTFDAGETWKSMQLPLPPNTLTPRTVEPHPIDATKLIYIGTVGCNPTEQNGECYTKAFVLRDATTDVLATYVDSCQWTFPTHTPVDIVCSAYKERRGRQDFLQPGRLDNPLQFLRYKGDAVGSAEPTVLFPGILSFLQFQNFVGVAIPGQRTDSQLFISSDAALSFDPARFPVSVAVSQNGYTVLESSSGAIFLDVLTMNRPGMEWGTILRSDSSGTRFTTSLPFSNRNGLGISDFEKMNGMAGIILANQLNNAGQVLLGAPRKVQSRISYDEGASWEVLVPIETETPCVPPQCSLHLHSVTERHNVGRVFSSSAAPGVMLGVGNIGDSLATYERGKTWLTRDGGQTWRKVRDGAFLHGFGDHGALIVVADSEEPVDYIWYFLLPLTER